MLGLLLQDIEGSEQGETGVYERSELPAEHGQHLQRYPLAHARHVQVLFHGPAGSAPGRDMNGDVAHLAQALRYEPGVVSLQRAFQQLAATVADFVVISGLGHQAVLLGMPEVFGRCVRFPGLWSGIHAAPIRRRRSSTFAQRSSATARATSPFFTSSASIWSMLCIPCLAPACIAL